MHDVELFARKFNCLFENSVMLVAVVHSYYRRKDAQVTVHWEDHFELEATLQTRKKIIWIMCMLLLKNALGEQHMLAPVHVVPTNWLYLKKCISIVGWLSVSHLRTCLRPRVRVPARLIPQILSNKSGLVAAQCERPLVPARILSIASRANANSLHALWPIKAPRPTCTNQDAWAFITPRRRILLTDTSLHALHQGCSFRL